MALGQVAALAGQDLQWDLVLSDRDRTASAGDWADFAARVVHDHGRQLSAVQITGEANLPCIPAGWSQAAAGC